jgi:hypothetical protein
MPEKDNSQVYALEDDVGRLQMYVTGSSGMNLMAYLGRPVYLFGNAGYDGVLRTNYMVVMEVRMGP